MTKFKNVTSTPYDVYEILYRRNGEKMSELCNTRREANARRKNLKRNRRKFLGIREVRLVEV